MSLLELQFSRLATMGYIMEEQMRVTVLISSFPMTNEYSAVAASVSTNMEEDVTWSYVKMIFIKAEMRLLVSEKSHSRRHKLTKENALTYKQEIELLAVVNNKMRAASIAEEQNHRVRNGPSQA